MVKQNKLYFVHPTADVSKQVLVGKNTKIWHQAQIRENVIIGENCVIGKGSYVDKDTLIGNNVKIQNYASVYHKAILENGVFIGPYVCLTNDKLPRAIAPGGKPKFELDWTAGKTIIKKGASIGTGTIVLPNIRIGEFAMIGAGSIVTENVAKQSLVYGSPAKLQGYVCKCGEVLSKTAKKPKNMKCKKCRKKS
jgi:acetyltransferase-like isoleucine patch superfamily enzyme